LEEIIQPLLIRLVGAVLVALQKLGKNDQALVYFDKVLDTEPNNYTLIIKS